MKVDAYTFYISKKYNFDTLVVKTKPISFYEATGFKDNKIRIWEPIENIQPLEQDTTKKLINKRPVLGNKKIPTSGISSEKTLSEAYDQVKWFVPEHFISQSLSTTLFNFEDTLKKVSNVKLEGIKTISLKSLIESVSVDKAYETEYYILKPTDTRKDLLKLFISNLETLSNIQIAYTIEKLVRIESKTIFDSSNFNFLKRIVKTIDKDIKIKTLANISDFIKNNLKLCISKIKNFSLTSIASIFPEIRFINEAELRIYTKYKGAFSSGQEFSIGLEDKDKSIILDKTIIITNTTATFNYGYSNYLSLISVYFKFQKDTFSLNVVPSVKKLENLEGNETLILIESIVNYLSKKIDEKIKTRVSIPDIPIQKIDLAIDEIVNLFSQEENSSLLKKEILENNDSDDIALNSNINVISSFKNDIEELFTYAFKGYTITYATLKDISTYFNKWANDNSNLSISFSNMFVEKDPYYLELESIIFNIDFFEKKSTSNKRKVVDILKDFRILSKELNNKELNPTIPLNSRHDVVVKEIGYLVEKLLDCYPTDVKTILNEIFIKDKKGFNYEFKKVDNLSYRSSSYSTINKEVSSGSYTIENPLFDSLTNEYQKTNKKELTFQKIFKRFNNCEFFNKILLIAMINKYSENGTSLCKNLVENKISSIPSIVENIINEFKNGNFSYQYSGYYFPDLLPLIEI